MDEKKHKAALQDEIQALNRLKRLDKSEEFNDYFDLVLKTVTQKMIWAFAGENVKDWSDFVKVRAEIVAMLHPIQEIRGAEALKQKVEEQLQEFYGS